jgi:pimeloyl-ACP methyl ester carboxylesterase
MRVQAKWVVVLLVGLSGVGRGAEEEKGFQLEQRVREATRLDWEFAAGAGTKLPGRYDSRQQRYQLFVPATYKSTKSWPLVLFVSPGDDPLGWPAWRKPCEDGDLFFAAAYGAGNSCPPGQRVRAILDVLDDVRQHYHIDPDQTYLCGFGGGAATACRIAFALPEQFGGVIALSGDIALPLLDHLRRRAGERLSVALVSGSTDRSRRQLEKYNLPLLHELGVRSRLWIVPDSVRALPPAGVLVEVQRWLEKDLPRRHADRKERIGSDEVLARRAFAAHALEQARKELEQPDRLREAAAQLEWLAARWPRSEAGEKAGELLANLRADPRRGKALVEQIKAGQLSFHKKHARALESAGRLKEAYILWALVELKTEGEERRIATREEERLEILISRQPYLGISFAGDTTTIQAVTPGGPAHRAGLHAGDRLEQVGKIKVTTPEDVREQLREHKPGDKLAFTLRRDDKPMSLTITVGSPLK